MNLKESFRYQKFLDRLYNDAQRSIQIYERALIFTKTHLRSKANPDAQDMVEQVDNGQYYPNDCVLLFMSDLISQKLALSIAIGKAKASCSFDIDAAVEVNKYRQSFKESVGHMLMYKAFKSMDRGTDYKFNVEGNQVTYTYDIEVDATEAFDRDIAKKMSRREIEAADECSRNIDEAMVTIMVNYEAPYNVNDSFDDCMGRFLSK